MDKKEKDKRLSSKKEESAEAIQEELKEEEVSEIETAEVAEPEVNVEEIEKLKQEIASKNQEIESFRDRFLRVAAEFENYKKRVGREREEFIKFAQDTFILELLPILDTLEQARNKPEKVENSDSFVKGIELTYRQLIKILEGYGLSRVEVQPGDTFDHNYHEAVSYEESSEYPPHTIIKEIRPGYLLHSRILRPAMVQVSGGEKIEKPQESPSSSNQFGNGK